MPMTSNSYWRIAVPCPLRQLFTYSATKNTTPEVGDWVQVPFNNRKLVGLVLGATAKPSVDYQIKEITEVLREELRLPGSIIELILWSMRYYHAAPWDIVSTFLPGHILQGKMPKSEPIWAVHQAGFAKISPRARRQKELFEWLKQSGPCDSATIVTGGYSQALIRQLEQAGAIEPTAKKVDRKSAPKNTSLLQPTSDQAAVIDQINREGSNTYLLEGITGSGKTLVYQHIARQQLEQHKQVLILVPEIGLVPQMLEHCRQLVEQPHCYHSGMTDSQRAETWIACLQGRAQIVIGTRSALFLPFTAPGLIVVDEEHDSSYKQQEGMRYHARDIAVIRASQMSIPVLLGSATPSLESLYNAKRGAFKHLRLSHRVAGGELPKWKLLEGRAPIENAGLLPESLNSIRDHLRAKQQVLVFINRRGYAPCQRCSQCGWQASCDSCDSRYTYHKGFNELRCHRCDLRRAVPTQCPVCASQQLVFLGQGTERIAQKLSEFFPDVPVIRIDRDATKGKQGMQHKLDEIHASGAALLVGTQMLAKGHHFPNLSMALILDIDYAMMSADFRATEQGMQLVTQVAGRTGREKGGGEVLLQTEYASHPMLVDLVANNYANFAAQLLQHRQELSLPPHCYMAILRAESEDYRLALGLLQDNLKAIQRSGLFECQIIGPSPSPTERRARRYRFQTQIMADARSNLHKLLGLVVADLNSRRHNKKLRWHLDIDPISLD
jgi:primosomal protein N' (replication factor Y)